MEKKISQLTASVTKILDSLRQITGSSTLSRKHNLGDVQEKEEKGVFDPRVVLLHGVDS